MKRVILTLLISLFFVQSAQAWSLFERSDEASLRKVIKSQVKYANHTDLKKLISTYDKDYINGDGLTLDVYSKLVRDIWDTYKDIEYDIVVKNISVTEDKAVAEVTETSCADVVASHIIPGKLESVANSVYYFRKTDKGWKVTSDRVLNETTSLLYGDALGLDIKLTVPEKIQPDTEYSAILEFVPPKDTIAIASLASDRVEYPQKPTQEVFRALPEDHILERLFISNNDNLNEYIVASIGLTKTAVDDLSVKLSLSGFGYLIKRVNVVDFDKEGVVQHDVKAE